MKTILLIFISFVLLSSCSNSSKDRAHEIQRSNVEVATEFVDAFYSFNGDTLMSLLNNATASQPSILYYQKWAECGIYKVVNRPDCIINNDSMLTCPITVKDDLIGALEIGFNVTDTFHIKIIEGRIRSINTSSNDPDMYYEAKEWVKKNRLVLIDKPCEGIWEGRPTACACVKAMVAGFKEFKASNPTEL